MKAKVHFQLASVILILLFAAGRIMGQEIPRYADNRVLARFCEGLNPEIGKSAENDIRFNIPKVDLLNERYRCIKAENIYRLKKFSGFPDVYVLEFAGKPAIPGLIRDYMGTGCFVYVEPDYTGAVQARPVLDSLMPDDTWFGRQWALYNDGTFPYLPSTVDADIDMTEAWTLEQGDPSVVAGIIDSGCKLDHPELTGRIWINSGEIPGNANDDDQNGFVDDVYGWDFANGDNDPTDDQGHGTNVAGIIGANGNNSAGYAGVDWNCKLMILKGLNSSGWGYYSWWISAIEYAVDNGAHLINMSLVGTDVSQALKDGVNYALQNNVAVIACMGNANSTITSYPAAYSGVIAVGATNPDDTRCNPFFWGGGSNYNTYISVVAPGNYIFGLDYLSNTNYNSYWGGTSHATPHVTGLYSLLLAKYPGALIADIREIIETTAEDQVGDPGEDTPGWDQYFGYGRINARDAVSFNPSFIAQHTDDRLRIIPNPSNGKIQVITGDPAIGSRELEVTDITGRIRMHQKGTSGNFLIDLSAFGKGIYFLLVKTGKEIITGKAIIQ